MDYIEEVPIEPDVDDSIFLLDGDAPDIRDDHQEPASDPLAELCIAEPLAIKKSKRVIDFCAVELSSSDDEDTGLVDSPREIDPFGAFPDDHVSALDDDDVFEPVVDVLDINPQSKYDCEFCELVFDSPKYCMTHTRQHFKCSNCSKRISTKQKLLRHMRKHTPPEFPCFYCELTFDDWDVYKSHMHEFKCDICLTVFRNQATLKRHVRESYALDKCPDVLPSEQIAAGGDAKTDKKAALKKTAGRSILKDVDVKKVTGSKNTRNVRGKVDKVKSVESSKAVLKKKVAKTAKETKEKAQSAESTKAVVKKKVAKTAKETKEKAQTNSKKAKKSKSALDLEKPAESETKDLSSLETSINDSPDKEAASSNDVEKKKRTRKAKNPKKITDSISEIIVHSKLDSTETAPDSSEVKEGLDDAVKTTGEVEGQKPKRKRKPKSTGANDIAEDGKTPAKKPRIRKSVPKDEKKEDVKTVAEEVKSPEAKATIVSRISLPSLTKPVNPTTDSTAEPTIKPSPIKRMFVLTVKAPRGNTVKQNTPGSKDFISKLNLKTKIIDTITLSDSDEGSDDWPMDTMDQVWGGDSSDDEPLKKTVVAPTKPDSSEIRAKEVVCLNVPKKRKYENDDAPENDLFQSLVPMNGAGCSRLEPGCSRLEPGSDQLPDDINKWGRKSGSALNSRYICDRCDQGFISKFKLTAHLKKHEARYFCVSCPKTFRFRASLQNHVATFHTPVAVHACAICKEEFASRKLLQTHRTVHKSSVNKCHVCAKEFTGYKGLTRHLQIHKTDTVFLCDECPKSFSSRRYLLAHKVIHLPRFSCDVCGRSFGGKRGIVEHVATHLQEKKYACDVCNRKYGTLRRLQDHKRNHVKTTLCPMCGATFPAGNSKLKQHILKKHTKKEPTILPSGEEVSASEPRFQCDKCPKKFLDQKRLDLHYILHTDKFKCAICERRCGTKDVYTKHLLRHEKDEKQCQYCDQKFFNEKRLRVHIQKHFPKKFVCKRCKDEFDTKPELKLHRLTHKRPPRVRGPRVKHRRIPLEYFTQSELGGSPVHEVVVESESRSPVSEVRGPPLRDYFIQGIRGPPIRDIIIQAARGISSRDYIDL